MEGNRRNGKKTEKTIQRKISKGRSADSNLLFASGGIYVGLYWFFIPAIKSMRLSFYNYSYITPERTEFVGFDNFVRLFHDKDFLKALQHTFLMVAVVVLLIAVLAFLIAVLLDGNLKRKDVSGRFIICRMSFLRWQSAFSSCTFL